MDDPHNDGALFGDFIGPGGVGAEDAFYFAVFVHEFEAFVKVVVEEGDAGQLDAGIGGFLAVHDAFPRGIAKLVDARSDDGYQGKNAGGVVGDLDI